MVYELMSKGIEYLGRKTSGIKYKGNPIGNYRLDYLMKIKWIVELKYIETIGNIHIVQVLTYPCVEKL